MYNPDYRERQEAHEQEVEYYRAIRRMAEVNGEAIRALWRRGDGCGGAIRDTIACQLGLDDGRRSTKNPTKRTIGRGLMRRVMERDEYRCVACSTHLDLTCDHIVPESKGGPTSFENLQTMCRSCNSRKGARI